MMILNLVLGIIFGFIPLAALITLIVFIVKKSTKKENFKVKDFIIILVLIFASCNLLSQVFMLKGIISGHRGNYDTACNDFEKSAKLSPIPHYKKNIYLSAANYVKHNIKNMRYIKGEIAADGNKIIYFLEKALGVSYSDNIAHELTGMYFLKGDWKQIIEISKKFKTQDENVDMIVAAAYCYEGKWEDCINISKDKEETGAKLMTAVALKKKGDIKTAQKTLQEALSTIDSLEPDNKELNRKEFKESLKNSYKNDEFLSKDAKEFLEKAKTKFYFDKTN